LPMPRSLLTAGVELDPVTEREREARMEELKAELGRMLAQGKGGDVIDRVPERVNDFETAVERILCCVRSQQLRFAVGCELMLKVAA